MNDEQIEHTFDHLAGLGTALIVIFILLCINIGLTILILVIK